MTGQDRGEDRKPAYRLIIFMGMVSLFGDITYEGARSITGPYLAVLGASAGVVGIVAGFGEFLGYAFRMASGYLVDRVKAYWLLTFTGYAFIFAIPLLAFTRHWQWAAVLIVLERLGKAIRTPARDAILSHAAKRVGRGWGFGLHEFFDQVGAVTGPLVFTMVFVFKGDYAEGFNILWVPAVLSIAFLSGARMKIPHPEKLEPRTPALEEARGMSRLFWLYALFTFLSVAGVTHFSLISYHLKVSHMATDLQIPVLYIIAMAADGVVALAIGKIYDRIGLRFLIAAPVLSLPVAFLSFLYGFRIAIIGIVLWGAVVGIHETVMRAAIADITPVERRGMAYGIFNAIYGLAFFAGSTAMGFLYDVSPLLLIALSVLLEVLAIITFAATGFYRLHK